MAGLAELGGGRLPEAALYAFLLASGIYLRVAGERGAVVRPHNLPGIKGGLCRLLRAEETAWRQVREYVAGKECRRRPLLAAYDARPGRCGGCDHCGSEYSWQVGAALQFTERLAALGRRIAGLPLHHGLALLQGAELGGAERTLAEYAVFRNS